MNELETMREPGRFQHFTGRNQTGGIETELRVLAAARRPFSAAFAVKPNTDADVRFHTNFLGGADRLLQLFEFLDDDNGRLAKLSTKERDADVSFVLVAVADDEALRVFVHGERSDRLRLAPGLETEVKLLPRIDDLLDHLAQLIDLDRKNAAIISSIVELAHGGLKRAVDRFDAMPQQILKANDQRETEPAVARFVHDFEDVDLAAKLLGGLRDHVTPLVDREISAAPAIDIVSRNSCINVPFVLHFFGRRHWR